MGAASITDGAEALLIVRNPCTHDSRVLREARVLRRLGYRPQVLAVVSTDERRRNSTHDGIPILRLDPGSPLGWLRSRLRRAPGDAQRRGGAPPGGGEGEAQGGRGGAAPEAATQPTPGAASGGPGPLVRLHRWLRTLDYYRLAIRELRRRRPAIVHCNDYNTMWVGVAARASGAMAVVYDAHELWPDRNLRPEPRWWLLACEWLFVRVADRTITASPGYAQVMARRYRIDPPAVVRNIPELAARPAANGSGPSPATGAVTYLGALTRNRGLETSIRALALVPEARLRLVGPIGSGYRAELEQLADSEGVAERVELTGPVPPERAVDAVRGSAVGLALIQPACLSYELSLPNKLFEYVLAGVPVLASDLPVIGGFVREHRLGAVAGAADVPDVARKLTELLEPERNRRARAAVGEAAAGLSWDAESEKLEAVYREAAAVAIRRAVG